MSDLATPRLLNLLASLSVGLHDDGAAAMERAIGMGGSAPAALLALDEFLGGANVGRLAEVLGLTHSGAVRLATQLESAGLVRRRAATDDRRNVEVRLTAKGRRRVREARAARAAMLAQATEGLDADEQRTLEVLLERLVAARVRDRMRRRAEGEVGAWWCRTCDLTACGRPEGRCPAQASAAAATDL